MSTLSPQSFQNLSWHLEEEMIHELYYEDSFTSYNQKETDSSYQSHSISPVQPDIDSNNREFFNISKKSSHNAYERDRRKKLNHLYSSLYSLLPGINHSKKLSIPSTVARVIKYIPELQRHVDKLKRRKEGLLSKATTEKESISLAQSPISYPIFCVTRLSKREVMIQICTLAETGMPRISKILKDLEGEGLHLINASTFKDQANKTFCNLHLQVAIVLSMEGQMLHDHILSILTK